MIQFPCPCGHAFSLDDDQAGGFAQCPRCRRLNDVPGLGELRQIAADGTYKIEAAAPLANQRRVVADLAYIYQKNVRDHDGNEIDLRTTPAELEAIGTGEPIPLVPAATHHKHSPRYDPETGALITAFKLENRGEAPVDPADIPMAKPALSYASGTTVTRPSFLRLFVNLLMPLNIAVMFAVFVVHVLLLPVLLVVFWGIMFLIVAIPFLAGAILAHYGNVIEDVGPFERDELPRLGRDVGWHEDLWSPFCNVLGSLLICYGPTFLLPGLLHRALVPESVRLMVALALAIAGTFLFPAIVLTLQCGGTILNLRPDRVGKVILTCGKDYFITLAVWLLAVPFYLWGCLGTSLAIADMVHPINLPAWIISWTFTIPALAAGIFLMHYFCMCVGMLYRIHYDQFPWVLQRHERTKKDGHAPGLPPSRRVGALRSGRIGRQVNHVGGKTAHTRGPTTR